MRSFIIAIGLLLCILQGICQSYTDPDIRNEFEIKFAAWKMWITNHPKSSDHTGCKEFKDIVNLGPKVVPFLTNKIQEDKAAFSLTTAIGIITKVRIPKEKWPEGRFGSAIAAIKVYQEWWDVDRKNVKDTYNQLKDKWDNLKVSDEIERSDTGLPILWYDQTVYDPQSGSLLLLRRHNITDLGLVYLSVKDLGIDILPLIIIDLEDKKYEFLPIFIEMTQYQINIENETPDQLVKGILEWWNIHKEDWIIPDK